MNDVLEVLSNYETVIYEETMNTLEMILGPSFIAIVAGILLGITLTALKKGSRFSSVITLPLRLIMMMIAGSPVILIAILFVPFVQDYLGGIIGVEAAQPILIFWGTFYFASLIYRSLTHYHTDGTVSMNMIQNLRQLLLGMIATSAVLGMIGMGGLGGILLQYGFFKADYAFAVVIAMVYGVMILCVEFAAFILKSIFKPRHMVMPMTPEYVAQLLRAAETEEKDHIIRQAPKQAASRGSSPQTSTQTPTSTTTSTPPPQKAPQAPLNIDSLIRKG